MEFRMPYMFVAVLLVLSLAEVQIHICGCKGSGRDLNNPGSNVSPTQGEGYIYKKSQGDYSANIPIGRRAIRDLYKKSNRNPSQKNAGLRFWDFMGPGNIGGKVKTIVVVPNPQDLLKEIIIIGAASGGIWRSFDDGGTWIPVNDFMASLAITHIVVHPSNPDILYASTGDGFGGLRRAPGAGIFKSTDRGGTWQQLSSTDNDNFLRVNRLAIDINDGNILFAVVSIEAGPHNYDGKIFRSVDGGNTWMEVGSDTEGLLDIRIDPHNSNIVLVGGDGSAMRSDNGGMTFTPVFGGMNQLPADPDRVELAFAPGTNGLVYASIEKNLGELWKSSNSGLTWQAVNTGNNFLIGQGWHNNAIWVNPLNSNQLIVGGVELFRSTNGGVTLTLISNSSNYHTNSPQNSIHADQHAIVQSIFYTAQNPKVFIGNDGGVQMTGDIWSAGQTSGWTNLAHSTLGITQVIGAAVSKSGSVYSAGTQDNSFHTGSTAGNWFQWGGGDGGHCAIDQGNDQIIYNTIFSRIYKSTDGGTDYNLIREVNGATYGFPFGMDRSNSQILIAGETILWTSLNGGSTWSVAKADTVDGGHIDAYITAFDSHQSSNLQWVGYHHGVVERRFPGTSNWSGDLRDQQTMPDETITGIAINPASPTEAMVSFAGYHTDHIWYTTNNGASWQNRSLTYPMQVNCIIWHPSHPDWVYIGTDYGVLASEDKGLNWSLYPLYPVSFNSFAHDGPVYGQVFQLFWQGDGSVNYPYHLCAATFGRGIWRSAKPVLEKVYIDKNCVTCGLGTMSAPYQTFREAANNAGIGATLVFLSSGNHDEVPQSIIVNKRFKIEAANPNVVIH